MSNRKGKVNARTKAVVKLGRKQPAAIARQDVQERLRVAMDLGVSPKRIKEVAEQVGAKMVRLELMFADAPPLVTLPPRSTKQGASKLDTKLAREICKHLQRGAQLALVCSWVGITPSIMRQWMQTAGEPYETFRVAVKQSLAYAEMKMINQIVLGSYNDPKIAIEWMKMRYPAKYVPDPKLPGNVNLNFDLGAFLEQAFNKQKEAFEKRRARVLGKVVEGEKVALPESTEAAPVPGVQ